jgi:hypothetical protein
VWRPPANISAAQKLPALSNVHVKMRDSPQLTRHRTDTLLQHAPRQAPDSVDPRMPF